MDRDIHDAILRGIAAVIRTVMPPHWHVCERIYRLNRPPLEWVGDLYMAVSYRTTTRSTVAATSDAIAVWNPNTERTDSYPYEQPDMVERVVATVFLEPAFGASPEWRY